MVLMKETVGIIRQLFKVRHRQMVYIQKPARKEVFCGMSITVIFTDNGSDENTIYNYPLHYYKNWGIL